MPDKLSSNDFRTPSFLNLSSIRADRSLAHFAFQNANWHSFIGSTCASAADDRLSCIQFCPQSASGGVNGTGNAVHSCLPE